MGRNLRAHLIGLFAALTSARLLQLSARHASDLRWMLRIPTQAPLNDVAGRLDIRPLSCDLEPASRRVHRR